MKLLKYCMGVVAVFFSLIIVNCSDNEDESHDPNNEIKLSTNLSLLGTRSTDQTLQTYQLVDNTQVGLFVLNTGTTTSELGDMLYSNFHYEANGEGGLKPVEAPMYYPKSDIVYIYSYAPYNDSWNSFQTQQEFEVAADQTTVDGYLSSDLLFGVPNINPRKKAGTPVCLDFKHVLARINVNLTAGNVAPETLKNAKVSIINTLPETTFNPKTGEITAAKGMKKPIIMANFDQNTEKYACTAIVVPQTIAAFQQFIQIDLDGVPFYHKMSKDLVINKATQYTFDVKVMKNGLEVTTEIDDWLTGDQAEASAVPKVPVLNSVADVDNVLINQSYVNRHIVLNGRYLSGVRELYCNGVAITDFEQNQTQIKFLIPRTLPCGDDVPQVERDQIRVVSNNGEENLAFTFLGLPQILDISYTLPVSGDEIIVKGRNLGTGIKVYFPSNVEGEEVLADKVMVLNSSEIKVIVPEGVGDRFGSIHVVDGDLHAYTPQYMFYNHGIICSEFAVDDYEYPNTELELEKGDISGAKVYDNVANLSPSVKDFISDGGTLRLPSHYLAFKSSISDIEPMTDESNNGKPYDVTNGRIKFSAVTHLKKLLDGGKLLGITGDTPLSELALQIDVWMSQPWTSGALCWRNNKNMANSREHTQFISPWTPGKEDFTFAYGWRTVTIPFTLFASESSSLVNRCKTLSKYLDYYKTALQMLSFSNWDANHDGHISTLLQNFQMNISNIRLVPYAAVENENIQ